MSNLGLPSLKEFVDALGVAWPIAFASGIASGGIVVANFYGLRYAAEFNGAVVLVFFAVAVFSWAIVLTHVLRTVLSWVWAGKDWWLGRRYKKTQLQWLRDLPQNDHYVMAYLFTANTRAFTAPLHHRSLANLMTMGLVVRRAGQARALDWPHFVPDHVWEEMERSRMKFTLPDGKKAPTPFGLF